MNPDALLEEARRMVRDPSHGADGAWARSAVLLARQALEQAIRQRLIHSYGLAGEPPFKALLLASRAFLEDALARRAAWTWAALSRATHHHGYELAPNAAELERWMDTVEEVLDEARTFSPRESASPAVRRTSAP